MSIKRIFIVISAIFAASAVFADNSSVTSKKYVDDLMSGYQGKLPGSGANKLMIYDAEAGIGEKSIETTLVSNATGIPTVGAVKTGLDGVQDTITGTAGYVMTGTGNLGSVGEKPIYSSTIRDEDSLVTAESVNSGVINAVNHSLRRVNANGELDNNGTLWEIADTVVALTFLPAGYTQLQYIESDGTQYIDTGIGLDAVNKVTGKVAFLSKPALVYVVGGRGVSGRAIGYALYSSVHGGFTIYNSLWPEQGVAISTDQILEFETVMKNAQQSFVVDGDNVLNNNVQISSFINSNKITLFSLGNEYLAKAKIYAIKFYKDSSLVADFIPASHVENSVTVVGMYDIVHDVFYPDAAGGNFIAGPAVAN